MDVDPFFICISFLFVCFSPDQMKPQAGDAALLINIVLILLLCVEVV